MNLIGITHIIGGLVFGIILTVPFMKYRVQRIVRNEEHLQEGEISNKTLKEFNILLQGAVHL